MGKGKKVTNLKRVKEGVSSKRWTTSCGGDESFSQLEEKCQKRGEKKRI